ncbi:MAG TPA: STT3 domain-containing protein [Candidatus Nanoarchaeia archaeon]|nr:STT3 domain-containing protein [Candidatus Nanoarchaeia archaeon]
MSDELTVRKEKVLNKLIKSKNILIYIGIILIAWFGYYIRTRNLWLLNGYLADPDAHVFARYAKFIVENGHFMSNDPLRYFPLGFDPRPEFGFFSYVIAYSYKIFHVFSSMSFEKFDVMLPAIFFIFVVIVFFFLVKKIFDYRVALLASLFLAILPAFLFRTLSGVTDKESFAILLMFLALLLYVWALKTEKIKYALILAILSGIITGLTSLTWGGVVYILITIGGYAIIELLLGKFTRREFFIYFFWFLFAAIIMIGIGRYTINSMIASSTTLVMMFAFFFSIVNFLFIDKNLLKFKERFKLNVPDSVKSLIFSVILLIIITSIIHDITFIPDKISGVIHNINNPLNNRWAQTVAESHQPYISSWPGQFGGENIGWWLIWLTIIGSIILVYKGVSPLKKSKLKLTIAYAIFIILFVFSRYSPSSKLNGDNGLSHFMFYGGIIFFLGFSIYIFLRAYYKDPEEFESIQKIDKTLNFIIVFFLIGIIGARTAIRLIFTFAPLVAILVSFLAFETIDFFSKNKKPIYKIASYAIVLFVMLLFVISLSKSITAQAKYAGPIYNQQWQAAGEWTKTNTPKSAVFAHWWDYGYLVQTGFERATVTDGGNSIGPWNYYMGRHVLTAQNLTEPLPFLKSHNVTHLLIVSDEIGKYPAFSAIGSDTNYDRYSWIGVYSLDQSQTQQTRNQTIYLYRGGINFDEDTTINGQLYARNAAGVAGFFIPIQTDGNNTSFGQPSAVVINNNQRVDIPLECIYLSEQEIIFPSSQDSLKGCLRFIPTIDDQGQVNPIGAAIYLSPRVRRTLFAHLYIYGEKSDIFKLAYSDENQVPLAVYQGRIIGPIKIWEVNYPPGVKTDPIYLSQTYPNPEVTLVNPSYG